MISAPLQPQAIEALCSDIRATRSAENDDETDPDSNRDFIENPEFDAVIHHATSRHGISVSDLGTDCRTCVYNWLSDVKDRLGGEDLRTTLNVANPDV
jgi:hypothetical protein